MMKVNTICSFLTLESIRKIEEKYDAKYVLESCLRMKNGNWANFPAAIFYTKEPHPEGSNYFAIFRDTDGDMMITNGISAVEGVSFIGIEAEEEVVYSRYRHDYRTHKNGAFIDGGRDYARFGGDEFEDYNRVVFKVENGEIKFLPSSIA